MWKVKVLVTLSIAVILGAVLAYHPLPSVMGWSPLSICTSSTAPCPSGGCQSDEVCKVISSGGTCGCVPVNPWPYSGPDPY